MVNQNDTLAIYFQTSSIITCHNHERVLLFAPEQRG